MVTHSEAAADLYAAVAPRVTAADEDLRLHSPQPIRSGVVDLSDALYSGLLDPHEPQHIFGRLRWGGQYVFVTRSKPSAIHLARRYAADGFEITQGPAAAGQNLRILGVPI